MIYTRAERVKENNKTQILISYEDAVKEFNNGAELWFFIEAYTEIETDDYNREGYDDEEGYKNDSFQMTCLSLDIGDTEEDINPLKDYYLPL